MKFSVEVEDDGLEEYLKNLKQDIEKASDTILDEIATYTLRQMRLGYIESEFQPGETMSFTKDKVGNEVTLAMSGPQAWYTEFGTGTRGKARPHPFKNKYSELSPYNSGKTIRRATKKVAQKEGAIQAGITPGMLYWTYKAKDGNIYYTRGIPSQRIVYTAGKLAKKKLEEIVNRNMKKVMSKK